MVRHTLKIFKQMLQDFQSVSGHFVALCIKGLTDEFTTFSEKKPHSFTQRSLQRKRIPTQYEIYLLFSI